MRSARRPLRTLLAAAVAAALAVTLGPAAPAGAVTVKIDKRLFGVHDRRLASLSTGKVGALRLWDVGVTWRDIETAPGVYDFSRLDGYVSAAQDRGAEVTLVLGMTPDFYATTSTADKPAATSMPNDTGAWVRYIQAVAARYANWRGRGRGIGAYQTWNEANVINFWSGSPVQLGQLTSLAVDAVHSVDRGALVIGPGLATRLSSQLTWMTMFYRQPAIGGVPLWKKVSAIALHLYPMSNGTPETALAQYNSARYTLGLIGVPKSEPIWVTEINYGARTGASGSALPIAQDRQAGFLIRTYMLLASRGVQRVDWYAWDMQYEPGGGTRGNTLLTNPADGQTLTMAGRAYGLVRGWLLGGSLVGSSRTALPCAKDRAGTWTCMIKYSGGVKRVYWNPTKRVSVRTVKSATVMVRGDGKQTRIKGGSSQRVGYLPLMVRSRL